MRFAFNFLFLIQILQWFLKIGLFLIKKFLMINYLKEIHQISLGLSPVVTF